MNRLIGKLAPVLLAAVVFLALAIAVPGSASPRSIVSVLVLSSLLGIIAAGQTLAVLLGGIDMSIPAVVGLADVLTCSLGGAGYPPELAFSIILLLALVIGAANGFISRRLSVSPLVVTLATSSLIYGAVWASTHGNVNGSVPQWLTDTVSVIGTTGPLPLPVVVVAWVALTIILIVLERRTVLGRWIYAVGSSPRAASVAGVPELAVWCAVYALSAALAAIGGIFLAGFSGAADPQAGDSYLFTSVAAIVMGGTSLIGGRGTYLRTFAGCIIITELTTLLVGLGLDQSAQQICLGLLLLILISIYGRERFVGLRL